LKEKVCLLDHKFETKSWLYIIGMDKRI